MLKHPKQTGSVTPKESADAEEQTLWTRRDCLKAGLVMGLVPYLPACGDPSDQARPLLLIPPTIEPVRTDERGDHYELALDIAQQQVLPNGSMTTIWGYNGSWPGPTFRVRSGQQCVVNVTNNLPEQMSVHLHGANNVPEHDGHPNDFFRAGRAVSTSTRMTWKLRRSGITTTSSIAPDTTSFKA